MITLANIADAYKYTHSYMYPENTKKLYSVLYVRNPKMDLKLTKNRIAVYGIKNTLEKLDSLFVDCWTKNIDEIMRPIDFMGDTPFYKKIYDLVLDIKNNNYNLSDILEITHVPDGTILKKGEPVLTVENKIDKYFWFVNYVETFLNSEIWKSCFIATQALKYKLIEIKYTGEHDDDSISFHDFSARGMSGVNDVADHNQAHLLYFSGSDSIAAVSNFLRIYPNKLADGYESKIGYVVPASEHSVMCTYGQDDEIELILKILRTPEFNGRPVAIVCDTYDLFGLIDKLNESEEFKELLAERDMPVVIRPDSGDPFKILLGDPDNGDERYARGVIDLVEKYFGTDKVKIIYGDAITPEIAEKIYSYLNEIGKNPRDFLYLGVGSYTYQYGTRDSVGLVSKTTHITYDDSTEKNLIKSPKTDSSKNSLTGRVEVKNSNQVFHTLKQLRKYVNDQINETW